MEMAISSFRVSFFKGFLNERPTGLISPFARRFYLQDIFEPVLLLQALIDLIPGTGNILADLAFPFLGGSSAGPVKKALGASRNRAYPSGFSEDAFPAGTAIFLKPSDIPIHSDKDGIQSGEYGFLGITFGKKLNPRATGH